MNAPAVTLTPRRARRKLAAPVVLGLLVALVAATAIVALCAGAANLSPAQVLAALSGFGGHSAANDPTLSIVTVIRLPRLLLALLVGATLAISGAALQGLFRNSLADPGLIGVSAGAALGAVSVIVLGAYLPVLAGAIALPIAAGLGGLAATAIVYSLGRGIKGTDVATLLLAGIAINAIAGAATGLLMYLADDRQLRSLTFWLMGSLGGASWGQLQVVAPFLLISCAGLCVLGRPLNAFLLGEDVAHHLGYPVEKIKIFAIVLCAMGVGAAVAVTGVIGFVGLVVPHLLRLSVGANHRLLLPASALLGAVSLIAADTAARTIVDPAELPIGILTALLGGPFFIYLLMRHRKVA